jgi:hypothetical protein
LEIANDRWLTDRLRQGAGNGIKLGQKKKEAIAALLTQRNLDEAAKAIGVAPNTLLKSMKLPDFDAAYRQARRALFGNRSRACSREPPPRRRRYLRR